MEGGNDEHFHKNVVAALESPGAKAEGNKGKRKSPASSPRRGRSPSRRQDDPRTPSQQPPPPPGKKGEEGRADRKGERKKKEVADMGDKKESAKGKRRAKPKKPQASSSTSPSPSASPSASPAQPTSLLPLPLPSDGNPPKPAGPPGDEDKGGDEDGKAQESEMVVATVPRPRRVGDAVRYEASVLRDLRPLPACAAPPDSLPFFDCTLEYRRRFPQCSPKTSPRASPKKAGQLKDEVPESLVLSPAQRVFHCSVKQPHDKSLPMPHKREEKGKTHRATEWERGAKPSPVRSKVKEEGTPWDTPGQSPGRTARLRAQDTAPPPGYTERELVPFFGGGRGDDDKSRRAKNDARKQEEARGDASKGQESDRVEGGNNKEEKEEVKHEEAQGRKGGEEAQGSKGGGEVVGDLAEFEALVIGNSDLFDPFDLGFERAGDLGAGSRGLGHAPPPTPPAMLNNNDASRMLMGMLGVGGEHGGGADERAPRDQGPAERGFGRWFAPPVEKGGPGVASGGVAPQQPGGGGGVQPAAGGMSFLSKLRPAEGVGSAPNHQTPQPQQPYQPQTQPPYPSPHQPPAQAGARAVPGQSYSAEAFMKLFQHTSPDQLPPLPRQGGGAGGGAHQQQQHPQHPQHQQHPQQQHPQHQQPYPQQHGFPQAPPPHYGAIPQRPPYMPPMQQPPGFGGNGSDMQGVYARQGMGSGMGFGGKGVPAHLRQAPEYAPPPLDPPSGPPQSPGGFGGGLDKWFGAMQGQLPPMPSAAQSAGNLERR